MTRKESILGRLLVSALIFAVGGATGWYLGHHAFPTPPPPEPPSTNVFGRFPVSAKIELLPDGRTARLLDDFAYIDPDQRVWLAKKGAIVDGASIPKPLWSIVGGPYAGKYRKASIVHDVACEERTQPSEVVHRMFYYACRCEGLPEHEAKLLFAAVYHFGPRWEVRRVYETRIVVDDQGKKHPIRVARTVPNALAVTRPASEKIFEKLKTLIDNENPSIDKLCHIDPSEL